MEVICGSWVVSNASGAVKIQGRDEIILKNGGHDNQLLLSMDIHDSSGELIAKLANNSWIYNEKERFALIEERHQLVLVDLENKRTVLKISKSGKNSVQIDEGDFYTHTGKRVYIREEALYINGQPVRNLSDCSYEQLSFETEPSFQYAAR